VHAENKVDIGGEAKLADSERWAAICMKWVFNYLEWKYSFMDNRFAAELMKIGIVSYKERETLYQIAKRCAQTTGIPMAGAGALIGLKAGSVTLPGVGTIAGPVAGALAGLFSGTLSCTMVNVSLREELRKLANGE
jgi:hypothetical protein